MPWSGRPQFLNQVRPELGTIYTVSPAYARLRSSPLRYTELAPKPGAHSREILIELGYSAQEVEQFLGERTIADQLHEDFLPA